MTCNRIRPLLSAYHDDGLSLDERARVRRHVALCDACRETLDAYNRLYAALQAATISVPVDVRRNVYVRISEIEARRGRRVPFGGTTFLGGLRTAGGTAGVLAVLAALIAAVVQFGVTAPAASPVASPADQRLAAANAVTAVSDIVGAGAATHSLQRLPDPVQTAAAPLRHAVAAGAAWQLGRPHVADSRVTVDGHLVRLTRRGAPAAIAPVRFSFTLAAQTPIAAGIAVGRWSAVPTIPAGDGAVYLHLDTDCVFIPNCGNSTAEVAYHSFNPGQGQKTLATPAPWPAQLFTGLNASLDGYRVAYSAMSTHPAFGGIFEFNTAAPILRQVLSLPDTTPLTAAGRHQYVKQVYAGNDGHFFFAVVDGAAASVAITTTKTYATLKAIGQPTLDYVMSPDRRHIAWTVRPGNDFFGPLQVADLGAQPMTRTITASGSRPVWSPDGQRALFLAKAAPGAAPSLDLWSTRTGVTQMLVAPPSSGASINTYAWAPGGRYFLYVVTSLGANGTSRVRLGDTVTGVTWPTFQQRYIGAIAWVHGASLNAMPAAPTAPDAAHATARAALTPLGKATTAKPALKPPAAAGAGAGMQPAHPAASDSAATPSAVLRSYYDAITRHDYARAYSYLASNDGRSLARFGKGYADTQTVAITQLLPAPYRKASNAHALTCVGVALVARHWNGQMVHYGGWYLVQSTTGQTPHAGGWRIVVHGTHVTKGGRATVPPQAACHPAPRSSAVTSAAIWPLAA